MRTTVNCDILLYMYTDTVPRDLYFDFWLVFRCEDMHQIWCPFPSFVGLATHLTAKPFSYLLCGLCTTKAGVFNLIWLYCCALATAYCNFATTKDNKLFYLNKLFYSSWLLNRAQTLVGTELLIGVWTYPTALGRIHFTSERLVSTLQGLNGSTPRIVALFGRCHSTNLS